MAKSIGVFAIIKNQQDEVLLVQDVTREQKWSLPGGALDQGVLADAGVIHEIKEETGLDAEVVRQIGIFSLEKSAGVVILFEARVLGGMLQADGIETADAQYFSWEALFEMRDPVMPAQLSMTYQALHTPEEQFPIYNHFVKSY